MSDCEWEELAKRMAEMLKVVQARVKWKDYSPVIDALIDDFDRLAELERKG